jgi:oligopeptide/dipeptide ABC transporter ATP-binding protein
VLLSQFLDRLSPQALAEARDLLLRHFSPPSDDARGRRIALIGLRGGGKSTVGRLVAERLGVPFIELDREIEKRSGATLSEIFDMFGQETFRRAEREALDDVLRRHKGASRQQAVDRAVELLGKVGITAPEMRLGQFPHQLSGGLRQRVMIAMALMCDPQLLIADEPTTALDVTVQAQILRLLASLQKELGLAVLLITHDLGIVARIADRVSVMYAGELVESAPTEDLFAAPQHPYTRGLLSCVPVPGKTRRDQPLGNIPGTVPQISPDFAGCAFRSRCGFANESCERDIPRRHAGENHDYLCTRLPETALKATGT